MCSNAFAKARRQSVSHSLIIVICVTLLNFNFPAANCLELYPFNETFGDNTTEVKDDGGSGNISLPIDFPFYNRTYRFLFVNNNGLISFHKQFEDTDGYKPRRFDKGPNRTIAIVAPYWSDVDIEHVKEVPGFKEAVYYRKSEDRNLLNRASNEIRENFVNHKTFNATLLLIATWYEVGFYGAEREGKSKRNTFQAVLVTDGKTSFSIFNYAKLTWTTGSNSAGETETGLGGEAAVVGFNSGVGQYYVFPSSGNASIINLQDTTNTGLAGRWIYQISGEDIGDLSCKKIAVVSLSPKRGSMLGHEKITVEGPCFSKYYNVTARIGSVGPFPCAVTGEVTAVCVTPSLFVTGDLKFEIDPGYTTSGFKFSAMFTVENVGDVPNKLIRRNPADWLIESMVVYEYDRADMNSANPTDVTAELVTYKFTNATSSFEIVQSFAVKDLSSTVQKFKLNPQSDDVQTLIMRLCWREAELSNHLPVCLWSDVFPIRWSGKDQNKSDKLCQDWLNSRERTLSETDTSSNCPCKLIHAERDRARFTTDPYCDNSVNSKDSALNCLYYPSAQKCLRRNLRSSGTSADNSGELCCYDSREELMDIRRTSSGGTHNEYNYKAQDLTTNIVPYFSYFENDFMPYVQCCQYSTDESLCTTFSHYRNATECQGYIPPRPAQAAGDPHLVTLDGKNYSYNGVGDHILVQDKNASFVIQVRATQAKNLQDVPQNASVFSAVAVCIRNITDIVEIRLTETGTPEVLVNNQTYNIDTTVTTSQLKGLSLILLNSNQTSYQIVFEDISVSVSVNATEGMLNVITLVGEDSFRGNLQGLLGNYNDNPDDDFLSRNGELIPADSSMEIVHYEFGESWRITKSSDELILSPADADTVVDFVPLFIDSTSVASRNDTETDNICGSNIQCRYDYRATGNKKVALMTKQFTEEFKKLQEEMQPVIRCPYLATPENGNVTISGYENGSTAEFTCNADYVMIHGDSIRICQENSQWSGNGVMCAEPVTQSPETAADVKVIYIGASAGGGGLLIIVIVVVVVVVWHKKRKRKPPEIELEHTEGSLFTNPTFMERLAEFDGFKIPRPTYVDPTIFQEYF